jgi:hypothetical protein
MRKKTLGIFILLLLAAVPAVASWNALPSPTSANLNSIWLTSTMEGFIAGANGAVVKLIAGGATYEVSAHGTANFNDVVFLSNLEGYLLGDSGNLFHTTDGGGVYSLMPLGGDLLAADFYKAALNGSRLYFSAYNTSSNKSYLYHSTDGGTTFASNEVANYQIRGVALTGKDNFEWGSIPGTPPQYNIIKNGTIEVWPKAPNSSQVIYSVYFPDDTNGYA